MNKRYKVETLGCRTNQYESQAYTDQLKALGYVEAQGAERADVCIVNTCTVTESADKRSLYQIRKIKRENPGADVYVTGCFAERQPSRVAALEGSPIVVPNKEKEQLIERMFPDVENLPEFSIRRFDDRTRAFIKVQDGCNSYCSYCIIPFVRGRSRSKSLEAIVSEIRGVVDAGYKEIVLTGINIGDFDGGGSNTLAELVRTVDAIEGLERIRISSIDPDEVDDALLDAVINGKKTCPSMHVVLQSGSNKILKRMRRKYSREDFFQTAERLVEACPDFTFTTDVIVGFPGENEADFEETLDALGEVRFSKVHMFPYSERPKTRAAYFSDKVPNDVIAERKQRLMRAAEQIGYSLRSGYVGQTMRVLLEGDDLHNSGMITGHTANFLPVSMPKQGVASNDIVDVHITGNSAEGLVGELWQPALL